MENFSTSLVYKILHNIEVTKNKSRSDYYKQNLFTLLFNHIPIFISIEFQQMEFTSKQSIGN